MIQVGRGFRNSFETGKSNCLVIDLTVSDETGMQICGELHALAQMVSPIPQRRNGTVTVKQEIVEVAMTPGDRVHSRTPVRRATSEMTYGYEQSLPVKRSGGWQADRRRGWVPSSQPDEREPRVKVEGRRVRLPSSKLDERDDPVDGSGGWRVDGGRISVPSSQPRRHVRETQDDSLSDRGSIDMVPSLVSDMDDSESEATYGSSSDEDADILVTSTYRARRPATPGAQF
jgi:hypothetical protein